MGEVAHERLQVLHLRGVEEAQAFVDVGANPARFERLFEVLVAGAGTKQDRDVLGPRAPRRAVRVAHDGRLEQPRGLRRHGLRAERDRRLRDEAQHRRAVTPGARSHRGHWKAVGCAVPKAILELRVALHLAGQRVDEGQQLGHGAETVGDRPARRRSRAKRGDLFGGFVEQRGLGLTKAVDRLLAVPDDEDRRRRVGDAFAFAPGVDEQLDELPLRAAGVLELVDEHVVIARLQLQPAAGELLLTPEQRDGSMQHAGKVEQRVLVEQRLVFLHSDHQHAQEPAGQQAADVAVELIERLQHAGRDRRERRLMGLARGGRPKRLRKRLAQPLTRALAGRQEIPLDAPPQVLHLRGIRRGILVERDEVGAQPVELRHAHGPAVEERRAMDRRLDERSQPRHEFGRRLGRRLMPHVPLDEPRDGGQRDLPPVQTGLERLAQHRQLHAREQQPHVAVIDDEPARGTERQIERFARKPRHFRFVGDLKRGIDVGLERKLAQQAEAERVDRRDLDVGDALAQPAPDVGRELAAVGAPRELGQHAAAHLRRGLSRERDREDVARIDAGLDERGVPVHEHARLPCPGRRLEHDVVSRIDGEVPRGLIGRLVRVR